MADIRIIDNFFNKLIQKQLSNLLHSDQINWRYKSKPSHSFIKGKYPENQQFLDMPIFTCQHFGFNDEKYDFYKYQIEDENINLYDIFKKKLEFLEQYEIKILRIRSNFNFPIPDYQGKHCVPHIDWHFDHKTLIYYLNDSDGDTLIFNEKKIDHEMSYEAYRQECLKEKTIAHRITPKSGTAVIFDGLTYHAPIPPKDKYKLVINCNFVILNK